MTARMIKHREYTYTSGSKKILVPSHTEKHDPHIETQAEYYVAFELERYGWNVGLPLRRTQKGFDLYAEKDGCVLRVQVKGRTAKRGVNHRHATRASHSMCWSAFCSRAAGNLRHSW